jgi:tetratricopeptide repeat protein
MVGRYEAARPRLQLSHAICQELGDRHGEAQALWSLGKVADDMADTEGAADHWRKALQILDALQLPFADTVRDSLAALN